MSNRTGAPIISALFYEFPDDELCRDKKDEYLLSGDVLVAPVCYEHAIKRKVCLPKGQDGQTPEMEKYMKVEPLLLPMPL